MRGRNERIDGPPIIKRINEDIDIYLTRKGFLNMGYWPALQPRQHCYGFKYIVEFAPRVGIDVLDPDFMEDVMTCIYDEVYANGCACQFPESYSYHETHLRIDFRGVPIGDRDIRRLSLWLKANRDFHLYNLVLTGTKITENCAGDVASIVRSCGARLAFINFTETAFDDSALQQVLKAASSAEEIPEDLRDSDQHMRFIFPHYRHRTDQRPTCLILNMANCKVQYLGPILDKIWKYRQATAAKFGLPTLRAADWVGIYTRPQDVGDTPPAIALTVDIWVNDNLKNGEHGEAADVTNTKDHNSLPDASVRESSGSRHDSGGDCDDRKTSVRSSPKEKARLPIEDRSPVVQSVVSTHRGSTSTDIHKTPSSADSQTNGLVEDRRTPTRRKKKRAANTRKQLLLPKEPAHEVVSGPAICRSQRSKGRRKCDKHQGQSTSSEEESRAEIEPIQSEESTSTAVRHDRDARGTSNSRDTEQPLNCYVTRLILLLSAGALADLCPRGALGDLADPLNFLLDILREDKDPRMIFWITHSEEQRFREQFAEDRSEMLNWLEKVKSSKAVELIRFYAPDGPINRYIAVMNKCKDEDAVVAVDTDEYSLGLIPSFPDSETGRRLFGIRPGEILGVFLQVKGRRHITLRSTKDSVRLLTQLVATTSPISVPTSPADLRQWVSSLNCLAIEIEENVQPVQHSNQLRAIASEVKLHYARVG